MSDIHQEREKEKKPIFCGTMLCAYCLNDVQACRIKYLEDQILAYKEQQKIDLAAKKDLDEKLDKATADYRALWVENDRLKDQLAHEKAERDNLADTVTKMEKKVRDLDECNNNLRERLTSTNTSLKISVRKEAELRSAIDQARKVPGNVFNRGRIEGMEEIWNELRDVYSGRTISENQKIFGYGTTGEIIQNLSPTWFINRAEEHHEEEKKIKIGDEIVAIDLLGSDDSDCGIVYDIIEEADGSKCYRVIGPINCVAFGDKDIAEGSIRKTGKHYYNIPFDYIA